MKKFWRHAIQNLIIAIVRPYVIRELPGWGTLNSCVDYRWNWLWAGAPVKTIRDKRHGNLVRLDLSSWSDRSYYFLGRWYDLESQLLIADVVRTGETIVDVGANRGNFALAASHVVGSRGKVICFEPNPHCVQSLSDEIELNKIRNITLHQFGLAAKDGILSLAVPLINSGEGSFGDAHYEDNLIIAAEVHRGDDFLANERPSLIKIDIDGFEPDAILGLANIIRRCLPVVITEISASHLKRAHSSVDNLKFAMEQLGYRGFKISLKKVGHRYDWFLTEFDMSNGEFDAVWLNTSSEDHKLIMENRFR